MQNIIVRSKDAILPVSYFPSVAYLSYVNQRHTTIELHENYQKRSTRNKSSIMTANGIIDLIVPLKKGKTRVNIKDVRIAYDEDWVTNHIRTIRTAYGTAAYFEYYFDEIQNILNARYNYLKDLSTGILDVLQKWQIIDDYNLSTSYVRGTEFKGHDLRPLKNIEAASYVNYHQVFEHKYGFVPNLSILDTLFNTGPECRLILDGTGL